MDTNVSKYKFIKNFQNHLEMIQELEKQNIEISEALDFELDVFKSQLRDYNKAIECFNKTIELDPKYLYGYNNKGVCYYSMNEYNKAIEQFNLALQLNGNDADAMRNKNCALTAMNQLKTSEKSLNQMKAEVNE